MINILLKLFISLFLRSIIVWVPFMAVKRILRRAKLKFIGILIVNVVELIMCSESWMWFFILDVFFLALTLYSFAQHSIICNLSDFSDIWCNTWRIFNFNSRLIFFQTFLYVFMRDSNFRSKLVRLWVESFAFVGRSPLEFFCYNWVYEHFFISGFRHKGIFDHVMVLYSYTCIVCLRILE